MEHRPEDSPKCHKCLAMSRRAVVIDSVLHEGGGAKGGRGCGMRGNKLKGEMVGERKKEDVV